MTGFGESLRVERERRGLSLADLCVQTKISERNLAAIEAEQYAELPPGVFRRGMVKAYLAALGLEGESWMTHFQQSYTRVVGPEPEMTTESWAAFAENVRKNRVPANRRNSLRWIGVFALLLVLCAAAYAVWLFIVKPRMNL